MSRKNPRKAIAALVPMTRHLRHGVVIRPMTLAMYAALERIKSPLVTGETPKDLMELVPSLYLITHDPRDLYRTPNLLDLAMTWADSLPVTVVEEIRRAAEESMREATDVIPEMDEDPKKKRTAGSPASSTGAPRRSTGASRTSSTASPSPQSASSGGRGSSPPTRSIRSRQ